MMNNDPHRNDSSDTDGNDIPNDVYGPSQDDIDRSWEDYDSGEPNKPQSRMGAFLWKLVVLLVSIVLLASLLLLTAGPVLDRLFLNKNASPEYEQTYAQVKKVLDSKTFVISSGNVEKTVRMIGVESPVYGDMFFEFSYTAPVI